MSFKLYTGPTQMEYFPKKASIAFAIGDLVLLDANGQIDKATSTTDDHIGVIMEKVTSDMATYATNAKVQVMIPEQKTQFRVPVGTGTAAATNVGEYLNLTDEKSVDVTTGANRAVLCTKVLSAGEVVVKINSTAVNKPSV
jgi:hypothetical protein